MALGACTADQADLQSYISQVKQREPEDIPALPRVNPPESFAYTASDMRDPFTGGPDAQMEEPEPVLQGTGEGPKPPVGHRREVLEGFELDSLQMVGTFEMDDEIYGLVTDPDGLVHRVQSENYVGRNYGRIVAVRDDKIVVQELIPNGAGGWMYRDVSLALDES
jgi:type IV pilus assembly protein PilP